MMHAASQIFSGNMDGVKFPSPKGSFLCEPHPEDGTAVDKSTQTRIEEQLNENMSFNEQAYELRQEIVIVDYLQGFIEVSP